MSARVGPSQRCARGRRWSGPGRRRQDVGRVEAPAEPRLEDRHVDLLGRQIGHAAAVSRLEGVTRSSSPPVRSTAGGARGALDGRGEALGRRVAVVDAHALGERHQVRRRVAPRAGPWRWRIAASSASPSSCRWSRPRGSRVSPRGGWSSAVSRRRIRSRPKRIPNSSSRAGSARRRPASSGAPAPAAASITAPEPALEVGELVALGWTTASGALATNPWLPAWPRRGRSRPRAARARPRAWPRPRRGRRRAPRPTRRPARAARPPARPTPAAPSGQRVARAGEARRRGSVRTSRVPVSSRHARTRDRWRSAPRRPPRHRGRAARRRRRPARLAEQAARSPGLSPHSSSVTNGITGWRASASRAGRAAASRTGPRPPRGP